MKNRLFLRNGLYIIIVLLPYVWAWGYAKGISYYENVLTWNTDVPYAFKLIWYYMVIAFTIPFGAVISYVHEIKAWQENNITNKWFICYIISDINARII